MNRQITHNGRYCNRYSSIEIILIFIITLSHISFCQVPNLSNNLEYRLDLGTFLSNGNTTFWQQANKYGIVPSKSPYFTAQTALYKRYSTVSDSSLKYKTLVGWSAGTHVVANVTNNVGVVIPEVYFGGRIGKIEIWGGRRKEVHGLVADTTLSTGVYSWSGNAMPIPKVQVNTIGFVDVPFTKGFVGISSSFSHGWFGVVNLSSFVRIKEVETYLHQKTLFLRLGKKKSKFNFYGGYVHNVMWGNEDKIAEGGPSGWTGYRGVVLGESWRSSRIGNHLGSIDLGLTIKGSNWNYRLFRQTFYEAGALYWLRAIPDGLNGFAMIRKGEVIRKKIWLDKLLFEFFHSINQGGNVRDASLGIYGQETNFNHYIYIDGWSYKGKIIGTPFIQLNNSRVYVYHIGAEGGYKTWHLRTKWSLSQNLGNYGTPLSIPHPIQLCGIVEAMKPINILGGSQLRTSLSFDIGKLYPNNTGIYIGLIKNGSFSTKK